LGHGFPLPHGGRGKKKRKGGGKGGGGEEKREGGLPEKKVLALPPPPSKKGGGATVPSSPQKRKTEKKKCFLPAQPQLLDKKGRKDKRGGREGAAQENQGGEEACFPPKRVKGEGASIFWGGKERKYLPPHPLLCM